MRVVVSKEAGHFAGRFTAMASPCEVLIETTNDRLAQQIADEVARVAWRIEQKFSRYRDDSVVQRINAGAGTPVEVDDETADLIDYAVTLNQLSAGRFDITSGALRRVWTFDGGDRIPTQERIDAIMTCVGWRHVDWRRPKLELRAGMQIDFGGIGKEYAVDRAVAHADLLAPSVSVLVNFGGDVAVRHARQDGEPWRVGIEHAYHEGAPLRLVNLTRGAIATSGDARRFVLKDGRRYSHILDALTGWPVAAAPRAITVVADTCTQAGTITTLAMLQGARAEEFLRDADVQHWLQR